MDAQQFITELANALGWPLVTLAIVLFFGLLYRPQIIILFDRLKLISGDKWRIEFFERKLEEAEDIAEDLPDTPRTRIEFDVPRLEQVEPKRIIEAAWAQVEAEIGRSLEQHGQRAPVRFREMGLAIKGLGILSRDQENLLDEVRGSFKAARRMSDNEVSPSQAMRFSKLALSLIGQIRAATEARIGQGKNTN